MTPPGSQGKETPPVTYRLLTYQGSHSEEISVQGLPPLPRRGQRGEFQPELVRLIYTLHPEDGGQWKCTGADVSGPVLRKDGSTGLRTHIEWFHRPLEGAYPSPPWLVALAAARRPAPVPRLVERPKETP